MSLPRLKPCPFCGRDDQLLVTNWYDETSPRPRHRPHQAVLCAVCRAQGPAYLTKLSASRAWNRRARIGGGS